MIPSFRIGGDTGIESPEAIKRQRAVALALLGQASDTSPTDVWGGAARVGQGVISALMNRRADKSEKRGQDDANQKFNAIIGSLMGPQASPTPVGAETVQPTPYEARGIPDPRSPEFTIKDDRQLPIVGGPGMVNAAPAPQNQPQQAPQIEPQGNEFEAAAQEVDALPMADIMELMNNPYLTEAQSNILGMVVKSKFDRGEWRSLGDGRVFHSGTGEVQDFGQQPKPTADMLEYDWAVKNGYKGSPMEFLAAKKGGTTVNVNTASEVGTIPQGYELFTDPATGARRLQPIAGGEVAQANEARGDKRMTLTDTVVGAAGKARGLISSTSTGVPGQAASYIGTTDAAEIYRQTDVLKANAKIENLTAMRRESPTGAALGSVTEKEADMLAAAAGALDPAAGAQRYQEALDNYEMTLLRIIHGYDAGTAMFEKTRSAPAGGPAVQGNRTSSGVPWSIEE